MTAIQSYLAMIAVGAFWGCTNPLLRHGTMQSEREEGSTSQQKKQPNQPSFLIAALRSLQTFRHMGVWLPYALNQLGSLLFYFTLGNSEVSLAVPICNGLALVFSIITSFALGETVEDPLRTTVGSTLVVLGVAICVMSSS
mmetsp:Transcript_26183/g.54652  ORF Transcript_26183/g.54652 Transcript_26183/m.54652 type:complete len:141 (-) Transcript_26183:5152-5574(-)